MMLLGVAVTATEYAFGAFADSSGSEIELFGVASVLCALVALCVTLCGTLALCAFLSLSQRVPAHKTLAFMAHPTIKSYRCAPRRPSVACVSSHLVHPQPVRRLSARDTGTCTYPCTDSAICQT